MCDLFYGEIKCTRCFDYPRSLWEQKLSGIKNFQHLAMYIYIYIYMPELQKFSFNSVDKAGVIRLLKLSSYVSAQQTLMKNNPVLMRKTF